MGDSKIKLTYFNVDGRALSARMMLSLAGVDFEDERISVTLETMGQWQERQKALPFGQLPILTMNGEVYPQTTAINNYLARKCGLDGGSERSALICDVLNATCNDTSTEAYTKLVVFLVYKAAPHPGDEVIETNRKQIAEKMDKILKLTRGFQGKANSDKFILGEKITAADMYLFGLLLYVRKVIPDLKVDDWVPKWESRFLADERVKNYLDNRPTPDI